MTQWGATPEAWAHFDMVLGLTADLLPVVSNPNAKVSPDSKMKALGKTPSWYNGRGEAAGIAEWTTRQSSGANIDAWMREPDYGICLQTRAVRALDIDVEDPVLAKEIEDAFAREVGGDHLARRIRHNSGKRLVAFSIPDGQGGDEGFFKRSFRLANGAGLVEFLATGQQFVAVGTHTSGVPTTGRAGFLSISYLSSVTLSSEHGPLWLSASA
jgi:hypothetical protein